MTMSFLECRCVHDRKEREVGEEILEEEIEFVCWWKEGDELLERWRDRCTERKEEWVALRGVVGGTSWRGGIRCTLRRSSILRGTK